jgi:hypothetical protein
MGIGKVRAFEDVASARQAALSAAGENIELPFSALSTLLPRCWKPVGNAFEDCMALSAHDELILLRKRARRRLVGAVVLVTVSTGVLWNVVGHLPDQQMRPESVEIARKLPAHRPSLRCPRPCMWPVRLRPLRASRWHPPGPGYRVCPSPRVQEPSCRQI